MKVNFDVAAAKRCLAETITLIKQREIEDVIRQRFGVYLSQMFPDEPWWVKYHSLGAESHVKFAKRGKSTGGFVDSLVGLTAIEYEKDISQSCLFRHGLDQVKDYCAGLLNNKHAPDLIIGVLSDTLRWRAYRISSISKPDASDGDILGRDHIELEQIDAIDITDSDDRNATRLGEFLSRHLGREGARPLSADTLARDLGFDSQFCERHMDGIFSLVDKAFMSNPKYAKLIQKLWRDFVVYLGEHGVAGGFDKDVYVRELYILTLAKLLCANVIAKTALTSDDIEVRAILNGDYFKLQGLTNLVEYDYFGWLNEKPHVGKLIPVAKMIQDDLRAYDFRSTPTEDLFGATMAQLAKRSQRLLLGQEWTPTWLAAEVVGRTFEALPEGEDPHLVDMCCGSGAMIIEAVKLAKSRLDNVGLPPDGAYVNRLTHAITGFDIDPLAVILSKIGWVLAARDRLEPFGVFQVSIPIYHADSLFAATPLAMIADDITGTELYDLILDDRKVGLPAFLVSTATRSLFDAILNSGYTLAMQSALSLTPTFSNDDIKTLLNQSQADAGVFLEGEQSIAALTFCSELVTALDALQRDGRNGIWVFVLRNSYRPGLVAGLFNGIVSNPPWLALSKIADNPYKDALQNRAEKYGIKPLGPSHLHIELSTIFLLNAVERYLCQDGAVGCILPETVLSGHQHNPFRQGAFLTCKKPVLLGVDELWRIKKGTFKNEAIILFGKKNSRITLAPSPIPGQCVSTSGRHPLTFNLVVQGNRVAWSDQITHGIGGSGFFKPAEFRQGADVMPRTLIFFEATSVRAKQWSLRSIDRRSSQQRFLITDAKIHKDFFLSSCVVPDRFVFDVLMSNHLTPFEIDLPSKGLLPIEKDALGKWRPIRATALATRSVTANLVFNKIFEQMGPGIGPSEFFDKIDSNRRKLTSQLIPETGWGVFMGAGGDYVCAAYANLSTYTPGKLIIDQTLYWTAVDTEDEAMYLVGLLNSEAINTVIKEFQPRGQFGARHVHTLPIGVTPPYDPEDAAHSDVVETTRRLMREWSVAKKRDPEVSEMLDPNKSLAHRRRKLREKIYALAGYSAYSNACRSLYGV